VNNASNYLRAPFDELTEAIWDASLDTNLKAPFLLAWHVGRAMRARGTGRIVNLADWAGERPYRDYLPYCVSKAGIICLTKALAKELAPQVTVNAVAPGPVMHAEHVLLGRFLQALRRRPGYRLAPLVQVELPAAPLYGRTHWSVSGRGVPGARAALASNYLPGRNLLLGAVAAVHCAGAGIPEI